ncbi:hypothetical protein [Enterococcus ratti]|uniref:Uncharacterized protein n=1 Tax=Enterococcus ratti TaxID=150033 RepID=A0A1L8WRY2_9ENTE|nr:hypothetical protein [Enterococcus ratti]OJG83774.1 hypothetical protein RV14_GL001008 [Enterococcus ratti]
MEETVQQKISYYNHLLNFKNKQITTLEEKIALDQTMLQDSDFKRQTKIRAKIIGNQQQWQNLLNEKTLIISILDKLASIHSLLNHKNNFWSYFFSSSKELRVQQKLLNTYEESLTKLNQELHSTNSQPTKDQRNFQEKIQQIQVIKSNQSPIRNQKSRQLH